jgi:hypothetical protein
MEASDIAITIIVAIGKRKRLIKDNILAASRHICDMEECQVGMALSLV